MLGPGSDFQLRQFRLWQACAFGVRRRLVLDLTHDGFGLARGLGSSVEAAFALIFLELGHARILSQVVFKILARQRTYLFGVAGQEFALRTIKLGTNLKNPSIIEV